MLWLNFSVFGQISAIIMVLTRRKTPSSAISSGMPQPAMVSVLLKMMFRLNISHPSHIRLSKILTTVSARYASDIWMLILRREPRTLNVCMSRSHGGISFDTPSPYPVEQYDGNCQPDDANNEALHRLLRRELVLDQLDG